MKTSERGRRALRRSAAVAFHALVGSLTLAVYALVVAPAARVSFGRRRAAGLRPRILWAPVPIISIRYHAMADRAAGYPSETLVYDVYRINHARDFDHVLSRYLRLPVVSALLPYVTFLWAGLRYDVFCFFFDGGLLGPTPLWRAELPLLRLAGKRSVVYPYGGDARLPSATRRIGRWHAYTDVPAGTEDRDERTVRRRLSHLGRHADRVLGCADLVEDLPRADAVMPFPIHQAEWTPHPEVDDGIVTIVHSPNHRHYKGTRYLERAVAALRAEGLPVELTSVEGMPNDEARRVYERADIIADQFLIGAYALFAIEGMALGKPVMCWLNPRFAPHHPEWAECPIVSANPDTLVEELRRLVTDPALRSELGSRGPGYVAAYHSLEAVGAFVDRVYSGLWAGSGERMADSTNSRATPPA